jgi:hypothetical protein
MCVFHFWADLDNATVTGGALNKVGFGNQQPIKRTKKQIDRCALLIYCCDIIACALALAVHLSRNASYLLKRMGKRVGKECVCVPKRE